MKNPVKTYQYLSWLIHEEDSACYRETHDEICGGSFTMLTKSQRKKTRARINLMLERITKALREAEIEPETLFPTDDRDWKWDGQKIMYKVHDDTWWPNIEGLLKRIQDTWDE